MSEFIVTTVTVDETIATYFEAPTNENLQKVADALQEEMGYTMHKTKVIRAFCGLLKKMSDAGECIKTPEILQTIFKSLKYKVIGTEEFFIKQHQEKMAAEKSEGNSKDAQPADSQSTMEW